jgi:hypothetical protein
MAEPRASGVALASIVACVAMGCSTVLGFDEGYGTQLPTDGDAATTFGPDAGGSGDDGSAPASDATSGGQDTGSSSGGQDATSGGQDAQTGGQDATSGGQDAPTGGDDGPVAVSPLLGVQSGTTTMPGGQSKQSVNISSVDPTRSFLLFGTTFDSATPEQTEMTGRIGSSTQLVFTRTVGNGAPSMPVHYYVASFQSGVSVQRDTTPMSSTTVNVTLSPAVDLATSFPLVSYRNSGTGYGEDDYVRAEITSPTTLTLSITLAAPNGVADWQVVSFDGASVQSGNASMGGSDTQVTGSLAQSVNPATTWVVVSNQVANTKGTAGELLVSGRLDSPTSVAITRGAGGGTQQITYYAVSFTNATTVASGSTGFSDQAKTSSAQLPASPDPSKSVAATGGSYEHCVTTGATEDNPGFGTMTLSIGGSSLSMARGASGKGSGGSADWSVIQFF